MQLLSYIGLAGQDILHQPIMRNQVAVLHPLTTLARLALFSHCPQGTRLAFYAYSIELQLPSLMQGLVRTALFQSKNDLWMLEKPIKTAVAWYEPTKQPLMLELFQRAIAGLERLKGEYAGRAAASESRNHIGTLDNLITILTRACNDPEEKNRSQPGEIYIVSGCFQRVYPTELLSQWMAQFKECEAHPDLWTSYISKMLDEKDRLFATYCQTQSVGPGAS